MLFGEKGGKYPHGNSVLVEGSEESLLIDPSLGLDARAGSLPRVDQVLLSHCHEDHIAGGRHYPDVPWYIHELDRPGLDSLDGFLAIYGFPEPILSTWRKAVVEQFHFEPRPDALTFRHGRVFELGGGVRVRVIHTPGHTRGHCVFLIEPGNLLYLGDIELSSFGPYYGDAWSDLESFERSLSVVDGIPARAWITFHHVGVLQDAEAFRARFDRFRAVIADREKRLLAFLSEPRSLDEVVAHRFVYRPGDAVSFADPVERRSMGQHLDRLVENGGVDEVEPGRFQRVPEPHSPVFAGGRGRGSLSARNGPWARRSTK